jgi:2-polyprenyl-3-methyl-5-hydroxy-6-metoxy-1,4-benzoquinol methylase
VREAVKRLGRKVRILEVGAGYGTLTWPLLEELRIFDVEYVFTDIGQSFLVAAKEEATHRGLSLLTTARLDLNSSPETQGFAWGSFDFVLSSTPYILRVILRKP